MPYYCTVPQCTSMAGKAKNVSFHQFPRDEELARLWNIILKRGKPYTKYSKVCSLHFRLEDYTITSVGKNKGQWRTLRKDAIPSRNLPSSTPPPTNHHNSGNRRNSGAWLPGASPAAPSVDPRLQHQMAQAIYMQTMLAMQARHSDNEPLTGSEQQRLTLADIEKLLQQRNMYPEVPPLENTSYKCDECSKCFKDPDVFVLHKRTHVSGIRDVNEDSGRANDANAHEKGQNNDTDTCISRDNDGQDNHSNDRLTDNNRSVENGSSRQETLRANPILANLLRTDADTTNGNVLDVNNILSIENQIMTALTVNMETYIKNLTHLLAEAEKEKVKDGQDTEENDMCQNDKGSDRDNDNESCQSDRHSDHNGDSDGENCQISHDKRHNDDGIGKQSDQISKSKSRNKNIANKSKSIKKRGRKSKVLMKKDKITVINKMKVKFIDNDDDNHESMDFDQHKNPELESTNYRANKNYENSSVLTKDHVTVKNEYDADNLDIHEPQLVTSDSLISIENKSINSIPDVEEGNNCDNHEIQNCTETNENHHAKSLLDEENTHLISKSNESERENHSSKTANSKIEQNDCTSEIELNSLIADKESTENCQNNIKNDNLIDSEIENSSIMHQNNSKHHENIVNIDENFPQIQNDEFPVMNYETGYQSPKYENKGVQTEGTCDELEETLYPAPTCDIQDLKPSKDSQIGIDDSL